jgi:hypothetical protein
MEETKARPPAGAVPANNQVLIDAAIRAISAERRTEAEIVRNVRDVARGLARAIDRRLGVLAPPETPARGLSRREQEILAARETRELRAVKAVVTAGIRALREGRPNPVVERSIGGLDLFAEPTWRQGTSVQLPFASPARLLPGEDASGLPGISLPMRRRDGRPQSERYHTCVACGYGKHDVRERDYRLCKDTHRVVGQIPYEVYRSLVRDLQRRGLAERPARLLSAGPRFDEAARELTLLWKERHLEFGRSAGEPLLVHPQSDLRTRRTLSAGPDGRPWSRPASEVGVDEVLHPIRGRYPRVPRLVPEDLAAAIGPGLKLNEDELMLRGERSARSDESLFEAAQESDWNGTASLQDFTDASAPARGGFAVYPQSDVASRRTISATEDGRPWVRPASQVDPSEYLKALRGEYPHVPRIPGFTVGVTQSRRSARGLGDPLFVRGADDPVLTTNARRTVPARETGDEARAQLDALVDPAASAELSALRASHADDTAGQAPQRIAALEAQLATARLRALMDPGTRAELRALMAPDLYDAARAELISRDWTEALHEDRQWEARRALTRERQIQRVLRNPMLGEDERRARVAAIEERWAPRHLRGGPLAEVTAPTRVPVPGFVGHTGVDEGIGPHEGSPFLDRHNARVEEWLSAQHTARVSEWLNGLGVRGLAAYARPIAAALRHGGEDRVVEWLGRAGVGRAAYDRVAGRFAEVDPRAFNARFPLNPGREIGDLTPEAPIHLRLDAQAAVRAAERHNWRNFGGPLSPDAAAEAIESYRLESASAQGAVLPPTPGSVAVARGREEALREVAATRAAALTARAEFGDRLRAVVADPHEFLRAFTGLPAAAKRDVLDTLTTRPHELVDRLGAAGRLVYEPADGPHGAIPGAATAAAVAAAPATARAGRDWLRARGELRRHIRAVGAMRTHPDRGRAPEHETAAYRARPDARPRAAADLLPSRYEVDASRAAFRGAMSRIVAEPDAFVQAFGKLPPREKRDVLRALETDPATLPDRLGAAGRLAPSSIDPRWASLPGAETAAASLLGPEAARLGRLYVAEQAAFRHQVRTVLRSAGFPQDASFAELRRALRSHLAEQAATLLPGSAELESQLRLGVERDALLARRQSRSEVLASLDRTYERLLGAAAEFRQQLPVVLADPKAFQDAFRGARAAEKHRVLDVLANRPDELRRHPHIGDAGRLASDAAQARAHARAVANQGRHYVEEAVAFQDRIRTTAAGMGLDERTPRSVVRSALASEIRGIERRLARIEPTLEGWDHAPAVNRTHAVWSGLSPAEQVQVRSVHPHLARAMDRLTEGRALGVSAVGRQPRQSLVDHSGQHRAPKRPAAGLEL